MKIKYIKNIDEFFKVIDSCEGDVFLKSKEGDNFNLSSKITRVLISTFFAKEGNNIELDLDIFANNKNDIEKIIKYMMKQ